MKTRSAHAVAGIGKLHKHLGRFAKAKHLNRGHNSDPLSPDAPDWNPNGVRMGETALTPGALSERQRTGNKPPTVTKRFDMADPSLAPGEGPAAEGAARQRRDALSRTRMIQGAKHGN